MSAITEIGLPAAPAGKARGYWTTVGRRIMRDKVSMACAFVLAAIFQRDLPLLQGTILVLALFFVILNLLVDIAQASIDPRIKRS